MRVLRARARELEQDFAFGVVRQLFERMLARSSESERAALLEGAAALARPLLSPAAPTPPPARPAPDLSFTLIHGLHWLTANLTETGPVMLALDDVHWADLPSLRYLAYLSARCEELPVLVVITVRSGEPTEAHKLPRSRTRSADRGERRARGGRAARIGFASRARAARAAGS